MIEYNKFKRKIVAPLNFACCETFFTGTIESVISAIDGTALCTSIRGWKRKLVAGRWHLSLINRSNSAKRTVIRTRSKGKPPPSSLFSSSPPSPSPRSLPHFIHLLVIFPLEIPDWRSLSKTITKKDDRYWANGRETAKRRIRRERCLSRDLFRRVDIVVSYEF